MCDVLLVLLISVCVILCRNCSWFFSELLYVLVCVFVFELMNWFMR